MIHIFAFWSVGSGLETRIASFCEAPGFADVLLNSNVVKVQGAFIGIGLPIKALCFPTFEHSNGSRARTRLRARARKLRNLGFRV